MTIPGRGSLSKTGMKKAPVDNRGCIFDTDQYRLFDKDGFLDEGLLPGIHLEDINARAAI